MRRLRTSINWRETWKLWEDGLPSIWDQQRKWGFEANTASKQPRRSNLKSDLKFMAQTTCATMFVWAVLTSLEQMAGRREKEEHLAPLDLSASPQVKRASSLYLQSCKRPRVSHPRTDRAHHCLTSVSPCPAVLPQGHRPSSASVGAHSSYC